MIVPINDNKTFTYNLFNSGENNKENYIVEKIMNLKRLYDKNINPFFEQF